MNKIVGLLIVISFALTDISLTTVFYCHGNHFYSTFSQSLSTYSFYSSVLELWSLSVLRCSLIFGLVVAVIITTETSIRRIKSQLQLAVGISAVICIFSLVKLLSVSENGDILKDIWFWSIFVWSLFCSVVFVIQWLLLGKISPPTLSSKLNINCVGDAESEPLLRHGTTDSADSAEGKNKGEKEVSKFSNGTLLRLVSFSKPDWLLVLIGFVFLAISSTGEIFIPFYTGRVVDGIVIDKSQAEFTKAIISMALISLGSAIAAGIRGGCLFIVIRRLNIRIRNTLFASILQQEIGFFDTVQTGNITSRLTSDTTTMSEAIGLNVNIFLRNFIKAVGVIFFMFKLSWRLTVVTFIGLPCILVVSKIYGKYYKILAEKVQDSLAEVNNVAEEACSSMRTVRSFANEVGETVRYADKLKTTYGLNKKQALMYSCFVWCTSIFELALTVSVLYYGGHLVIRGILTGGTLISFILYQIQLGDCVDSMGNVYTGLMEAAGASEKVLEYIDRKPQIINSGTLAPNQLKGHIEFKNVSFCYPSRPDVEVLKNISFGVKPGEVVALVGPSGGGKTSCVNLLEHFYTSLQGQVLLDGTPIQDYDHHYLHNQVALVGQEPVLYARSIEENIRYGLEDNDWTQETIIEASKMANAHQFVSELKDGYNTQTGEKGVQMSGGQKQRLAIARALLRKPSVLLLDEATSALDSESEFLVQQALYQNLSGRTVLIIAHRLSTVEKADRIIVIDKGRVVEQGTHLQLLDKRGMYSNLVKRQLLNSDSIWNDSRMSHDTCACRRRRRISSGRHISGNSTLSQDSCGSDNRVTFIVGSA